jgi:multiple antibiotic resistance protein
LLVAAIFGARILNNWGISVGALRLTVGIILFLVALQQVLKSYVTPEPRAEGAATAATPSLALAFAPLAFPMIVTPYGIALLILGVTLYPFTSGSLYILGVAGFVLVLDLFVMLSTDWIQKMTFVTPALRIVGSVMSVLQIALGVQVMLGSLRLLGFVGG